MCVCVCVYLYVCVCCILCINVYMHVCICMYVCVYGANVQVHTPVTAGIYFKEFLKMAYTIMDSGKSNICMGGWQAGGSEELMLQFKPKSHPLAEFLLSEGSVYFC